MSFSSSTYLFVPYMIRACIVAAFLMGILAPSRAFAESLTYLGGRAGLEKPIPGELGATEQSFTLKGSRGEVLPFLMKAEGGGCFPLLAEWDDATAKQSSLELSFFDLPEVSIKHPSFTGARVGAFVDPAVPLKEPATFCVNDGHSPHWLLAEIRVPKDIEARSYNVQISAGARTVAVTIVVWPMVIPDQPALPAYSELTPWFLVLGHYGRWHEDEAKLAQLYTSAMLEHRVVPLKSIIAPLKEVQEGSTRILDLENTPTPFSSFNAIVLRNRPAWAYYDFPTVGANGATPIDYRKAESYFAAVENTIPLTQRDGKALVYLWDEPKREALPELLKLSRLVKRRAPSLKQLVTTPFNPVLKDTVDIFAPVMDQYDASGYPAPPLYRNLQREAHEVWWYVSCMSHGCDALSDSKVPDMVIDRPASSVRSIGWLSMRYSIDAFLYYSVANGYQFAPRRDPWKSLWDFSGNGDGTLFYPGRPGEHGLSEHQPIVSLRLKLWRESSYDAEYISWMNQLASPPPWWRDEFNAIARSTTSWDREYSRYQRLRERVGEYLSSLQPQ